MFGCSSNSKDLYIEEAIRLAGGYQSQTTTSAIQTRPSDNTPNTPLGSSSQGEDWLKELRSGIIVMASVFAILTFQVALTPPGGVWQDWGSNATASNIVTSRSLDDAICGPVQCNIYNRGISLNRVNHDQEVAQQFTCPANSLSVVPDVNIFLVLLVRRYSPISCPNESWLPQASSVGTRVSEAGHHGDDQTQTSSNPKYTKFVK
ncbi:hypothetical protein Salat_0683300 [Sesamum alatum]|uniref:PGG domain-containing protein n=1 Tax=Sesamum alatum TaxID=300844 RepID=A0AAE2CUQ2_9LAMI|nr:hypothetical protein Salat_0683300 [Sesamum alatum]